MTHFLFKVREGDMTVLDPTVIDAVDLDIPRDRLTFSVIQQPQHGSIMGAAHGNDVTFHKRLKNKRGSEIPIEHFTMDDLRNGNSSLNDLQIYIYITS